mgnify:FL=1|tara:strand:- start:265 stop:483 length:219 start_codon:yes stop_codon:yes gene_type:complete
MDKNELDELRYDVAHYLLSKMSKGSQFQYALDRMLQLCDHYDEEGLKEILFESKTDMKNHLKKKKSKGGGFQ